MALPKVDIQLQTGQLGFVEDVGGGSPGVIVVSASEPTGHDYGVVKKYTKYSALPTELQIDQLKYFFAVADGHEIYVMPVVNTTDPLDIVDKDAGTPYAKNLIDAIDDDIWFIGLIDDVAVGELPDAITNAQALAESFVTDYKPGFILLPVNYDAALPDLKARTDNRVGVIISPKGDEVGLALGRLAVNPVQRNIGRVKDGALPVVGSAVYDDSTDPDTLIEDSMDSIETMHGKGYICLRTHIGKAGYFFTDDPLATADTDDYKSITNRRVIDKALVIAYAAYVNELLDEIEINSDGTINAGVIKSYQSLIENAVNQNMGGEISSFSAYIDHTQNVLSTEKITIVAKIVPVGYAKEIVVELGFDNPFLTS